MKNKKKLLIYSAVFVGIAALGVTGGIVVKKATSSPETDYSGFNIESVKPNVQSIMNKYNGYKGNTPETFFTAGELINIAQEKFRTCENCFSLGKGVGNTVMTQEIRNYQIKNGNKYFEESISKSIGSIMGISVALANRCYQEGETITKYSAKKENVTIEYSTYESESTDFALKDYKDSMGKTLDEMFIYIVSDNVIKTSIFIN